jgi:uncharacterized membrane protein
VSSAQEAGVGPDSVARPPRKHLRQSRLPEICVVGGLFLVGWYLMGFFLWSSIYRSADTAQLLLLTESAAKFGVPFNQVGATTLEISEIRPIEASIVCNSPLLPGPESYPNGQFNHLEYHAYYFAYALAPLMWVLPADVVIASTQALALCATVLLVYMILRQERVSPIGRALFCGLVVAFPVWNETIVNDLYMDRYFPPLALLYLAILYYALVAPGRPWVRALPWAIPVGILTAATNDRSILYLIMANAGVLILMGWSAVRTQRRAAITLVLFSVGLGLAFESYMLWVHTSDINTIPTFLGRGLYLLDALFNPAIFRFDQTYAELTVKFVVVNAVFFGIWGLWRWKPMLLAVVALMPNILTTLGGAEKVTFGFPYHSHYLPFLLLAAALGLARVWRMAKWGVARLALGGVLGVSALALVTFAPYEPGWVFGPTGWAQTGLASLWQFYSDVPHSAAMASRTLQTQVANAVPQGATVTSVQGLAVALYPGHHWFFYPINIDLADYAVLTVEKAADGTRYYGGAESYTGQDQQLNTCLTQRLERDGYDTRNPQIFNHLAVLHRVASS